MPVRSRQQKKQTRLSFETLPSSSPAKSSYSAAVHDRLASVRFQDPLSRSTRVTRAAKAVDSHALPTPEPSSQLQNNDGDEPQSPRRSIATPIKIHATELEDHIENDEQNDDDIIVPSNKRRKLSESAGRVTPSSQSSRLDYPISPSSNRLLRSSTKTVDTNSSPRAYTEEIGSPETSGDEEEVLISAPTRRRRSTKIQQLEDPFVDDVVDDRARRRASHLLDSAHTKRATSVDFVVDDHEIEYVSSDNQDSGYVKHRESAVSKKRRRSRREQDELDEDLKDLADSEQEEQEQDNSATASRRTRGGPVTTQRDRTRKHIEELKRRRAGARVTKVLDSDDESDRQFDEEDGADLDTINDVQGISAFTKEGDEVLSTFGEEEVEALRTAHHTDIDNEDDFIVYDEEENSQHDRRPQSGIPLAFTSFASSKPRELFIHIVEWLVKNKIAPAFSRNDELYALSWNKVNDQIKAQAGSRLISSAWNEDFKNAILARPEMQVTYLDEGYDEFFLNCDACNKSNHPARYEFKLSGHAYHKDSLEPIDEDDGDDDNSQGDSAEPDDDGSDGVSYDEAGHLLPSTTRSFNLGRFCAANAEMGHKLTHWKHHLNQALLAYLEEQGVLSAEAILTREKMNKKKREKEAENIVDMMQDTGIITEMWRDLQNDLEDARFGMEDHISKNGGRRNKKRIGKVNVHRPGGRIEEWSEGGKMKLVVPSDSEGE